MIEYRINKKYYALEFQLTATEKNERIKNKKFYEILLC